MSSERWSVVEAYRENGQTHRSLVQDGLTEQEAKEMASEDNAMLLFVGVSEHWVEAVRS